MSSTETGRTYRLDPLDRSGALLGLPARSVLIVGIGLVMAVLAITKGMALLGIASAVVGIALVSIRVDGGALVETLPVRLAWMARNRSGRGSWFARLPLRTSGTAPRSADAQASPLPFSLPQLSTPRPRSRRTPQPLPLSPQSLSPQSLSPQSLSPQWPPCLDGQDLIAVDPATHGLAGVGEIGVVLDKVAATMSATVAVSGRHFGLVDRADQDASVARWGEALAGFVRERGPICQLRWSEWAAPAGVSEHLAFIDRNCFDPASGPALTYRAMVADAAPSTTGHEVAVTLSVRLGHGGGRARINTKARSEWTGPKAKPGARHRSSGAKSATRPGTAAGSRGKSVKGSKGHSGDARKAQSEAAAIAALVGELRLFADRLGNAALKVSAPWSVGQLCTAVRNRLDPSAAQVLDRRSASLGSSAGLVSVANAGPLATNATWTEWRADSAYHRAFWIADWPRMAMPADWMSSVLGWAGSVRSVTVVMEPVSPRQSARAVRTQSSKLESDQLHRAERGYRVGAELRRAAEAVAEREEELVAGYRELTYAGVVTVTAMSLGALDQHSEDLSQAAGSVGIELRALHGRHDQGFAVSLPLGRSLAAPRWSTR